jgi:serine/threonine protein kinase
MGEIYKGIDKKTNDEVVLKLVVIGDPDDEELLLREIDASKKLLHKNIVKTLITGKII